MTTAVEWSAGPAPRGWANAQGTPLRTPDADWGVARDAVAPVVAPEPSAAVHRLWDVLATRRAAPELDSTMHERIE